MYFKVKSVSSQQPNKCNLERFWHRAVSASIDSSVIHFLLVMDDRSSVRSKVERCGTNEEKENDNRINPRFTDTAFAPRTVNSLRATLGSLRGRNGERSSELLPGRVRGFSEASLHNLHTCDARTASTSDRCDITNAMASISSIFQKKSLIIKKTPSATIDSEENETHTSKADMKFFNSLNIGLGVESMQFH
jgi:hypothetical protein